MRVSDTRVREFLMVFGLTQCCAVAYQLYLIALGEIPTSLIPKLFVDLIGAWILLIF